MRNNNSVKFILLLMFFTISQFDSFGQYASLRDAPYFKNYKYVIFKDSATNVRYDISVIDSLYKIGKASFQLIDDVKKGDSIIWTVKFITEENNSFKALWLNKEFPLKDFVDLNNRPLKKNDLKGKILIINCWSISCGPCVKEMPYLNTLRDSLNTDKYAFLGITFDNEESIKRFFKSEKLKKYLNTQNPSFNFTIIPNQNVLLSNILGLKSYPTTFIVNQQGIIKEIIEGLKLDEHQNPKVYSEVIDILSRM